jgi:lipoprotein-anchoring transpeptidase ErfK/SrfK
MSEFSPMKAALSKLSRRDFLNYSILGLVGLALPERFAATHIQKKEDSDGGELLGRVILPDYPLHEAPDGSSPVIDKLEEDSLWSITGAMVGQDSESPNRIWYEIDGSGYAHSRRIQPVKRLFNGAETSIPEDGCLGEITVPFVDAYNSMEPNRSIAYRFYYGTTFWILKRLIDDEETVWYQLLDDRYYRVFYIPAYYMRLVPASELTPISADFPPEDKRILVDLASQTVTAYEGDRVVFMSRVSTGVRLREGGFATPKGNYRTTRKRPCRHMANPANAYGSGFDLPGVPWVSYFTSDGVAFHGAYWHNDFGVPHSHGCINMTPQAAKWIYRWTTPTVPPEYYYYAEKDGTRVIVQ